MNQENRNAGNRTLKPHLDVLMPKSFKVRLHSNEPAAADATDSTLRTCPMGGGELLRENGKVVLDEKGYATVLARNVVFMKFAIRNQGYVAEVVEDPTPTADAIEIVTGVPLQPFQKQMVEALAAGEKPPKITLSHRVKPYE